MCPGAPNSFEFLIFGSEVRLATCVCVCDELIETF